MGVCEGCGIEAPTKYFAFYQNIGLLVIRFHKSVQGNLCKRCAKKYFWELTLMTFFLGWWGIVSFVVNTFFFFNNVIRGFGIIGMPDVPDGAGAPRLSKESIDKIQPHADVIFERLNRGESLELVSQAIGPIAGVSPMQVQLYVMAVAEAQKQQQRPQA
jgi:hypothetical protein